jgi:hypothetical protein
MRALASWIARIDDKTDPDRELILAHDGVKYVPDAVVREMSELDELLRAKLHLSRLKNDWSWIAN